MGSCRSSGVLTADAVISAERCKLVSIHAQYTGSAATTVKVFDNASAASGKELARIILFTDAAAPTAVKDVSTVEFDMHGVISLNGLFLEISGAGGMGAAVSVEYN